MKLRNWQIDGFGVFCDASLPDPGLGDGINLFVGPNEAGKSTLLDFLRFTLFGYPSGAALARRQPLHGGNLSGRVSYENESGNYQLFRQPGKRGAFDLRDQSGNALTEDQLRGHLGHVTPEVFRKIFGFSLAELQQVDLLQSDGVGDLIFAASVGSSAARIRRVQVDLQKRADRIFRETRTSGRNAPHLLNLHTDLVCIEERLAKAAIEARAVAEKLVLQQDKERALKDIDDALAIAEREIPRLDKLIRGWPLWVERCQAEADRGGLGESIDYPLDAEATWAGVKADLKNAEDQARIASGEVIRIEGQLQNLPSESSALSSANTVEMLASRRSEYDVSSRLALDANNRAAESRNKWNGISDQLGAQWTESAVRKFDSSLLSEDEARRLARLVTDSQLELSNKRATANALVRDARAVLMECLAKSNSLGSLVASGKVVGVKDITTQRSRLAEFRAALRSRDRLQSEQGRAEDYLAQVRLYTSQQQTEVQPPPPWIRVLLVICGVSLLGTALFLIYLGQNLSGVITITFGSVLIAIAILLRSLRTRRQPKDEPSGALSDAQDRYDVTKSALQDHDNQWRAEAASEGLAWPISENEFALWENRIRSDEQRLDQIESVSRELTELRTKRDTRYFAFHQAKREVDDAKTSYKAALGEWSHFLVMRELPGTIQPETAIAILGKVREGQQYLRDLDAYESEANQRAAEARAYLSDVLGCLNDASLTNDSNPTNILTRFEELQQQINLEQEQSRKRRELTSELDAAKSRLQEAETRVRVARDSCQDFLKDVGVNNEQEFRAMADRVRRQFELQQRIKEKDTALRAIFGPDGAPPELVQLSESKTLSEWEFEMSKAQSEKEKLSVDRDRTLQEITGLRLEIEKQLNSDEVARLQLEREELREEIRKGIADWLELATAQELLRQTRSKFEQENQSPALEEASRLFKLITSGHYDRIFTALDSSNGEVTILREDDRTLSIDCLSHGTLEQLYFSIRLGYIKQYQSQQNVQLPLVMDDVAVNFDSERMASTFQALADCVCRGQQILFFTCHEELIKLLRPEDRCFRIENFQFERQAIGPLILS